MKSTDDYLSACKREIEAAEKVCGKDAPQAQLVGHMAGEIVRLREALSEARNAIQWYRCEHPEASSPADDEFDERVDALLL